MGRKTVRNIEEENSKLLVECCGSTQRDLRYVEDRIKAGVRYVVVPICDQEANHWHMIILDMKEKELIGRNSLKTEARLKTRRKHIVS